MEPTSRDLPCHSADAVFAPFELHSEIGIAGTRLVVPHVQLDRRLQPDDWFAQKFAEGVVHEPRLVDWLVELAKRHEASPVRFYDVGALFGFFSVLAGKLFTQVELIAVEPDAEAARYVRAIAKANALEVDVRQVLLTGESGSAHFSADGFRFAPDHDGVEFGTAALEDILRPRAPGVIEILKIDTEGHQALFLPQAADELAARGAIILLELDRPEKLAVHGSSNHAVVAPFLERGYELWWCDHRDPKAPVVNLDTLSPAHERNSLSVLISPSI